VRQWREGGARALVTLVRAEGSSYRRPGAHLLVGAEGTYAGSISGGCLEAEVVRKAEWMVRAGARVERYSTMFDDTAEIPFGLGCGGVVNVLVEPAETAECRAYLEAMEGSLGGSVFVVVTWLPEDGRQLARVVFGADGGVVFASAGLSTGEIASVLVTNAALIASHWVTNVETGILADTSDVFVERVNAPQRLFVLGAGDDAIPVVRMAAMLGWNVTVVDGRAQMARRERFPEAERVVATADVAELGVGARDAVVVMSHSYEQDRGFLTGLLRDGFGGLIGLLGAAHRSSLLVSEAAATLGLSVAACCGRIHAPVGLDLGGDGPEAIALAVVAQVQAWAQGRPSVGRMLTAEFVAEQIARGGASRYLRAQCAVDSQSA
jgi:xanthine/CO dehydrogenase XdhC/CoxF family maturation factor